MKMTGLHIGAAMLGALLVADAAQAKHNFGLESVNQPVVTGNQAQVPNCPNWKSAGIDSAAVNDPNYGCAVNSNLAAMVADANDLIVGKTDNSTDTRATFRAIKAWHEAEPTSKQWSTTVRESSKGGGQ